MEFPSTEFGKGPHWTTRLKEAHLSIQAKFQDSKFGKLGFLYGTLGQPDPKSAWAYQIGKIYFIAISVLRSHFKITNQTQLDDNLGGADNFRAWKYRIYLILEENDLDQYISKEVLEPDGDEARDIYKMNLFKSKRIIADSIEDHLIPHVSSLKTPK